MHAMLKSVADKLFSIAPVLLLNDAVTTQIGTELASYAM